MKNLNNITVFEYLNLKFKLNKNKVKKLILENKILLNNNIVNNLTQLINEKDNIVVLDKHLENEIINKNNYYFDQIKIIYEDDYLLVLNKPSGLLSVNNNYENKLTLENWLLENKKNNLERSGIVHRLDKDTAGLLLVAKTNEVLLSLKESFKKNEIIRRYKAIVWNNFNINKKILINKPIGRIKDNKLKFTTNNPKDPKEAKTLILNNKKINSNFCLIECELLTGRTHQIRVHMNYINHPILNDPFYSTNSINDEYNQYLYSSYLSFIHPITCLKHEFELELPKEFNKKIKELTNNE